MIVRALRRPDDYPGMKDVANAVRRVTGQAFYTSVEDFARYYDEARAFDPDADVLVVERAGQILGYARAGTRSEADETLQLEVIVFVDPAVAGAEVFRACVESVELRLREIVAERRPPSAFFSTFGGDASPERDRILRDLGYEPVGWFVTMIRPTLDDLPDAPLPPGLEIREVRPEHLRTIWEAAQEAFQDHWGFTPETEEDYAAFVNDPVEGDTSLWRIAWDGDQVAGQVRSFINAAENEALGIRRGYVEHIGVRRPWRRRGLARALIAASFPLLRARGMTEGILSVDTENPSGALRVYEACGFAAVDRSVEYRKPL
jgi:ribosomal protein S18 acetylase RimI-like enzyme